MAKIIPLHYRRASDLEKALKVLLHKAREGDLTGLAFVAIKRSGICAGRIDIQDDTEAIEAARALIDAIRGTGPYYEPVGPPKAS